MLVVVSGWFTAACDVDAPPSMPAGAALHVVHTDLDDLDAGVAFDGGPNLPMLPRDQAIGFEIDRLLSPRTASRRNVQLVSGGLGVTGSVRYDPARRRVTFVPQAGDMIPNVVYEFSVETGLATWDGVPLGARVLRLFFATNDTAAPPLPATRPSLRADVAPLLGHHCAIEGCHAGTDPVLGLSLSSAEAIHTTAVAVLARETLGGTSTTGPTYTDPQWGPMHRIDPGTTPGEGQPAYSYLVYKLLGDGPIAGTRMPPPDRTPLTPDEIALVSDWIARGAPDD